MALAEREKIINPYLVERPYSTPTLYTRLGKDNLLVDKKFIMRFGHGYDGPSVVLFITSDKNLKIITELGFAVKGNVGPKSDNPGDVSMLDLKLTLPEKVFLAEGEYEINYLRRDNDKAFFRVSSTHEFSYRRVGIAKDAISYLRRTLGLSLLTSQLR